MDKVIPNIKHHNKTKASIVKKTTPISVKIVLYLTLITLIQVYLKITCHQLKDLGT